MIPALLARLEAQVPLVVKRVYALIGPAKCPTPYLTYRVINDDRDYTHQGFSGLSGTIVQIDCYSTTYAEAKLTAAQVVAGLESWPGASNIQGAFKITERDLTGRDLPEEATGLYHALVEFRIHHAA